VPAAVVLLLLSGVAACSKSDSPPSPFVDCSGITQASPSSTDLPALSLPCFTGGKQVAIAGVRGPAVINFWASWCEPCRAELPVMQQLATTESGKLTVIGVDTGDRRDAGASFAADKKVSMPTLVDQDQKLFGALGGHALPMTVFVDARGHRSIYPLPLDARKLAEQVRAHTGVAVTQ
jgi:thiol-disulfide isomerase/thioredoxin